MDVESDSSDDEQEMRDLRQLNAAMEAEKLRKICSNNSDCSDYESSDEEQQLRDLQQLNAVIEAEKRSKISSTDNSQCFDSDSSDEEQQLRDLQQLNAVIEAEKLSKISSADNSQCSNSEPRPSCSSSEELMDIEEAIAINKVIDEKLVRLETQLTARLRECCERLAEFSKCTPLPSQKLEKPFRYVNCGKPYFRDRDNFPAPDNEDTILMQRGDMYDYSSITTVPGWTVKDKSSFYTLILKMSRSLKKNEINSQIAQLRRDFKGRKKTIQYQRQMSHLTKELDNVDKKPLSEVALPIDQEYDWDAVASTLNRRHTAQEYKVFWKLYLHPSINKTSWKTAEHLELERIAQANGFQDWDKIAAELNTGRSGYQCFVYFRTNVNNTGVGQKWTKEEVNYLKRLVHFYREKDYIPWGKIASSMEGRTKIQIYNKYLKVSELKKGRFMPEEDAVILTCVQNFGTNFKTMTKYLPGRSGTQVRNRYHVLTNKKTNTSVVWTPEEDKRLIQIMANQDSSTNYSSVVPFFPGKNRIHIRARYVTLVKWMRKHPNKDLSYAPRRGARRLGHGRAENDINKALENLKSRIQNEVEKSKFKKISQNSSDADIESSIIAFLINENVAEEEKRKTELYVNEKEALNEDFSIASSVPNNANDVKNILILLRAKLDKAKFQKSAYCSAYPNLLQKNEECTVKVKSYSRKDTIRVLSLQGRPDVWGERPLKNHPYVFPPNYATITGCRKLMALATAKPEKRALQFNILSRRNVLFKEQMELLIERFTMLFLWPLLLSNRSPADIRDGNSSGSTSDNLHINSTPTGVAKPSTSKISFKF